MVAAIAPVITRPDEPRSGHRVATADFDFGGPSYSPSTAATEAASIGLDATLVAVDESGRALRALPVRFRQRVSSAETARLFGADPSGALRVLATTTRQPLSLKVNLRYHAGSSALPRELLPVFRFLRALRPPARLDLLIGDRSAGEPAGLPVDAEVSSGVVETTRSLAFVQAMTGIEFPMPLELDEDDLRELHEAEALLIGGTVSGRWNDARLGSTDREWLEAVDGAAPLRLEFVAPGVARIAGHEIPLGDASYVFRTAVIDDPSGSEVTLRPGTDDGFEVSLLAPPEIGLALQDLRPPLVASVDAVAAARQRPLGTGAFESAAS